MLDEVFFERVSNAMTPLHALYQLLWTQDKAQEVTGPLDFILPHTILIKEKNFGPWFFSDKKRIIRRKKPEKITDEHILEQFSKRDKKNPKKPGWKTEVIALYIYTEPDKDPNEAHFYTDYFDHETLKEFLSKKDFRSPYGV